MLQPCAVKITNKRLWGVRRIKIGQFNNFLPACKVRMTIFIGFLAQERVVFTATCQTVREWLFLFVSFTLWGTFVMSIIRILEGNFSILKGDLSFVARRLN
ncbi:MAG TPA: hypothetical protein PKY82_08095 [Pyrinomonadaceae bacterium]|nr:hypothetical protein [Pyrinomonadaceae bacterium]